MALEPMAQGARIAVALTDNGYWHTGTVVDAASFRVRLDEPIEGVEEVDADTIEGWIPEEATPG